METFIEVCKALTSIAWFVVAVQACRILNGVLADNKKETEKKR